MNVVTIIICTRNRAGQLHKALNALLAIRTDREWEALIVDNGSTDDTAAVIAAAAARNHTLRYLRVDRIGLGAARDAAWRVARGDIICFTDDDCYVEPDYVDAIATAFQEHPEIGGISGRIMLYNQRDARVTIDERDTPEDVAPFQFVEAGAFQGANLSFRRSVLEKVGGFDPELGAGTPFPVEDIDVCARVLWAGYGMRFDPRGVVHHHHGRSEADIPALQAGYDRGRGAYYAKCIDRPDMRRAYLQGWSLINQQGQYLEQLRRLYREARSGLSYLSRRQAWGTAGVFLCASARGLAGISTRIGARLLKRKLLNTIRIRR